MARATSNEFFFVLNLRLNLAASPRNKTLEVLLPGLTSRFLSLRFYFEVLPAGQMDRKNLVKLLKEKMLKLIYFSRFFSALSN